VNRGSDLPSIGFLVSTVERILADDVVTAEERRELYAAIETVLPVEARRVAATQRKTVEAEENERQRPLLSVNFMVAGVHYEGRADVVRDHVVDRDTVFLARDPENRFSRNAVEVRLRYGMQIGFVPESLACYSSPWPSSRWSGASTPALAILRRSSAATGDGSSGPGGSG
jgi:hypothetical protein